MNRKQQIITALRAFVAQRSGMDWRDCGDATSYRAKQRAITRDGKEARELLRAIEWRDSITADMIIEAAKDAFFGRLSIVVRDNGAVAVDYCAGQYFPTEYRKAVCALCASILWDYMRDHCMPAQDDPPAAGVEHYGNGTYKGMRQGDYIRAQFRREYGRGIASRWFN